MISFYNVIIILLLMSLPSKHTGIKSIYLKLNKVFWLTTINQSKTKPLVRLRYIYSTEFNVIGYFLSW